MTRGQQRIVVALSGMLGLFLLATGALLMFFPDVGECVFGVAFPGDGSPAFHHATGVRQSYLGLLVIALALSRQFRALGIALLLMTIVPAADAWIVLGASDDGFWPALTRHAPSVPFTFAAGVWLITRRPQSEGLP